MLETHQGVDRRVVIDVLAAAIPKRAPVFPVRAHSIFATEVHVPAPTALVAKITLVTARVVVAVKPLSVSVAKPWDPSRCVERHSNTGSREAIAFSSEPCNWSESDRRGAMELFFQELDKL